MIILYLLFAAAVMAAAVFVRTAPAAVSGEKAAVRDAYMREDGLPYLTDMDSYYHVRLVDNYLNKGTLGDSVNEDGAPWDTRSFYPEGRSAAYQPGIVYLTSSLWRIFGGSLYAIEYYLAALMAALSALAAFILGCRIAGIAGGITAGALVSCAPLFVTRSCAGRFDTDFFVVLMELLMILFMTEALRADTWLKRVIFSVLFSVTAVTYSLCWTPTYSMLFAGLTVFGGAVFCIEVLFLRPGDKQVSSKSLPKQGAVSLIIMVAVTSAGLMAAYGFSVFSRIISGLDIFSKESSGSLILPNLLESVSELSINPLFPSEPLKAFLGYVPGENMSIVNGIGGLVAFVLCFAGLFWLLASCITKIRKNEWKTVTADLLYLTMLGIWLVFCFILTRFGARFIEHLSIPTGLLAGVSAGKLFSSEGLLDDIRLVHRTKHGDVIPDEKIRKKQKADIANNIRNGKLVITKNMIAACIICAAAVIPAVCGSRLAASDMRPTVTDASEKAMQYVVQNAEDKDAVLTSWWDMGYYYESESMHPCLWDGGTQDPIRAILMAKAFTTDDLDLSHRILLMLSHSGNAAADRIMEHVNAKETFQIIWQALTCSRKEGIRLIIDKCSVDKSEADEIWSLMRPDVPKETYLIITFSMTRLIGWYEYYASWDFTGKQQKPVNTIYSYTPDGRPVFQSEEGQEYLSEVRDKEMLWRLFFNAEKSRYFTPAFEWHDGVEHVRLWKVEP